jgi:LPS O-antigen subunit length determinant protein (WzzB/FepE family)
MDFLNAQIAKTSYTEINQVIAQLLQNKIQQLTLIEANESYVFFYLDPPMVMEEKTGPDRSSMMILGFILGGMFGIFIVLIREFYSVNKNQ